MKMCFFCAFKISVAPASHETDIKEASLGYCSFQCVNALHAWIPVRSFSAFLVKNYNNMSPVYIDTSVLCFHS